MVLTFKTYLHHTDEAGNSFLDLELVLFSTPLNRINVRLTIPALANTDFFSVMDSSSEMKIPGSKIKAAPLS